MDVLNIETKEKGFRIMKIKKIYLKNFKSFEKETIEFNDGLNVFVGDNGVGKSTILLAIDLVLRGSITRVNQLGLENLFNVKAIESWKSTPNAGSLPVMAIELFFDMPSEPQYTKFYGEKYETEGSHESAFGIKIVCAPNRDFSKEISEYIKAGTASVFPFEFYSVCFSTFSGQAYTAYMKPLRSCYVDNASISTERTLRYVVESTYQGAVEETERVKKRQEFKKYVENFEMPNEAKNEGICISGELEQFIEIKKGGIRLENHGQGAINIYKTKSALARKADTASIFLVEEPENHLSHFRLRGLVETIENFAKEGQVFIATHSSYIATRLGLKNVLFINRAVKTLKDLDSETSNFFMKLPCDNLLQFVLSSKVILVEGAAEYILLDYFFRKLTGDGPERKGVWIISINGLSFPRYMKLGKILGIKLAVIRDNDGLSQEFYPDLCDENIKVFSDSDSNRYTFEVCLYEDNKSAMDSYFQNDSGALDYMLKHKTEAAFRLLSVDANLTCPAYINEAIKWIL